MAVHRCIAVTGLPHHAKQVFPHKVMAHEAMNRRHLWPIETRFNIWVVRCLGKRNAYHRRRFSLLGGALIHQPKRNTDMFRPGFSLEAGSEKTYPLACFQHQRPLA